MRNLGEISKKSKLFLELMTIDSNHKALQLDSTPLACIDYHGLDSIIPMDSVTLKSSDNGAKYSYVYTIPEDWKAGKYTITYIATHQNQQTVIQEVFTLKDDDQIVIQAINDHFTSLEVDNDPTDLTSDFLPPDFQRPTTQTINANQIILKPLEPLKKNCRYTVVLDANIQSVNGLKLNKTTSVSFTTEYAPLYAEPSELRPVLKELFTQFDRDTLYIALRDAGQKAHHMLGRMADANNSSFQMITELDTVYFPLTKFVIYEAAKQLLSQLLIKYLNQTAESINDQILISGSGGSITLGDLSIKDGTTSQSSSSSSAGDPTIFKIQTILDKISEDLQFWTDALFGRRARGYASPASAVYKSNVTSPTSRDF